MHQQLSITGYVGRKPELKYTQAGVAVTNINVAVNKKWSDEAGVKHEKTTWFRVSCWRRTAEVVAQYIDKGSLVQVLGDDVQASTWEDDQGNIHATIEVTAKNVIFLSTNRTGETEPAADIPI